MMSPRRSSDEVLADPQLRADLLGVLAGAVGMSLSDLAEAVTGPRPRNAYGHLDFRTRTARQWFEQWEELMIAGGGLIEAGLAEIMGQEPGEPFRVRITADGRRCLLSGGLTPEPDGAA